MAKIDIDRHILLEIITSLNKIKIAIEEYHIDWGKIIEVRDKTDVLFRPESTKGSLEEFEKLRNIIFKSTANVEYQWRLITKHVNKIDALVLHLVSEVLDTDTQKGLEAKLHEE